MTPEAIEARVQDALRRVERGDDFVSAFLDPAEARVWERLARGEARFSLEGGHEDAERCVAVLRPLWEEAPMEAPIRALCVCWNAKYDTLTHRDLLGALLGLGIKRETVGDLLLAEDHAVVWVLAGIADMVVRTLTQAGRASVHVRDALAEDIPEPPPGRPIERTLGSLRLDAFLSAGLDLSREKAKQLVLSGAVKQNHILQLQPDARVAPEDIFSIRGFGRLRFAQLGGKSRKDRYFVQMLRW